MRIGAIDIGTNSIHLLVADVDAEGEVHIVQSAREQAELGSGGLDAQLLAPDAFDRGVAALESFHEQCESFNVEHIACTATSAVREASNGKQFCDVVRARTGIHVRVIAGVEEARLIWLGTRHDLDFSRGRVLIFDVGGGSTEFILCDAESILTSQSLHLGHIRLAEGWHHSDPMSADEQKKLRKIVRKRMKNITRRVHPDDLGGIVGTSGTVRALARMEAMARGENFPEHQHGMVLTAEGVDTLVDQMTTMTADERSALPGMDTRRMRTLPSGAVLVQEVFKAFDKKQLVTSNRSLRDGIIVDWILKHKPELTLSKRLADPRSRSVQASAERYGVDKPHADAVGRIARQLFDATATKHSLRIDDRRLLVFAAQIHDLGHHISGRRHDKRGAYLIRHTHMPGFTVPETHILEALVRYHSGKKPKKKHRRYGSMSKDDRRRVRILSGMLCLADAFDRGHHQNVTDLTAQLNKGALVITAATERAADLERWATDRRRRRLEKALGVTVDIQFNAADAPSPPDATDDDDSAPPSGADSPPAS